MINLTNVVKTYDVGGVKYPALRGIDLQIAQGEYIAIVGTSGSGKSSLLNILGGMDSLTSGSYLYNEVAVEKLNAKDLNIFRKEHICFIFQSFNLLNRYTVFENVAFPLIAKGVSSGKRRDKVLNVLSELGILELKDKYPIHISGGQQQRTAIARALVSDNELILADEPSGSLDQATTRDLMNVFNVFKEKGRTLIIATHDNTVASCADRIIRIEDGKIV